MVRIAWLHHIFFSFHCYYVWYIRRKNNVLEHKEEDKWTKEKVSTLNLRIVSILYLNTCKIV